jgi:hypothetical protein
MVHDQEMHTSAKHAPRKQTHTQFGTPSKMGVQISTIQLMCIQNVTPEKFKINNANKNYKEPKASINR